MSSIKLESNASGTGIFTIASPNSNTNRTLTLPDSTGTVLVSGGSQSIEFAAGSSSAPSITTTGDTNTGIFFPAADTIGFAEGGAEVARFDSSANFQFNSGYGSVAVAYGCRAWVNFNGTGAVAIRASGNVSSITDNNTGDYTVNFTTAMPNANYAFTIGQQYSTSTGATDIGPVQAQGSTPQATTSLRVALKSPSGLYDGQIICVAIFR